MVSDNGKASERIHISNRKGSTGHSHAFDARKRFYSILLLFVVVVGLPIVSLPSLRHRLVARVVAFQEAIMGKSGPVMANMDEEQQPFPEEFERPDSAESDFFPMDRIFTAQSADSNDGIVYTQGEVEQEMYALVLKEYPQVAEMVNGDDPSLRFQSWGGVKRSEDIYWIRLVFQNDEDLEVEYIWQVELQTNQVLPLSYNARTIS
ncbi:MAG: hypothetical protein P8Y80_17165 [Acidobacteriota bacterium]